MTDCGCGIDESAGLESRTLGFLLGINGVMFVLEGLSGWWADSAGLLADSLDMLADASVYGIAMYAVGRSVRLQTRAAAVSGLVQISLGLGVLFEVIRRTLYGSEPLSAVMIAVGGLALIANVSCLLPLEKHRQGGIHMRASWIFSTNDVIANVGLMLSGGLVIVLDSRLPDLVIGGLVAALVIRGGVRILRETKAPASHPA